MNIFPYVMIGLAGFQLGKAMGKWLDGTYCVSARADAILGVLIAITCGLWAFT